MRTYKCAILLDAYYVGLGLEQAVSNSSSSSSRSSSSSSSSSKDRRLARTIEKGACAVRARVASCVRTLHSSQGSPPIAARRAALSLKETPRRGWGGGIWWRQKTTSERDPSSKLGRLNELTAEYCGVSAANKGEGRGRMGRKGRESRFSANQLSLAPVSNDTHATSSSQRCCAY